MHWSFKASGKTFIVSRSPQAAHFFVVAEVHSANKSTIFDGFDSVAHDLWNIIVGRVFHKHRMEANELIKILVKELLAHLKLHGKEVFLILT